MHSPCFCLLGATASSGEDGDETAASEGASLSILGEIVSKMILVPSIDELGLGVAGVGGLPKARKDLLAGEEKAAAAAAAAAQASEVEATSEGGEEEEEEAIELGMDIDG